MNATAIYAGSDGDATTALYERLATMGDRGTIALNLFRACKCSERAKGYRGRHKGSAYGRKQWSIDQLVAVLERQNAITWGWAEDPAQAFHRWVIYVDIPTGQVSFHTQNRGPGPAYVGEWDRQHGSGPSRIVAWTQSILDGTAAGVIPPEANNDKNDYGTSTHYTGAAEPPKTLHHHEHINHIAGGEITTPRLQGI